MKIQSYLPLFKGFYGSILDEIENHDEAARLFTKFTEDQVNTEVKADFIFQKLQRPRFYNFSNDEIHIEIKISKKEIRGLFDLCLDVYRNEFLEYIKNHFTSCDGFVSFYGNTLASWEKYMYEFYDKKENEQGILLSTMFDFYLCDILELNDDDLLEYAHQNGCVNHELI